MKNIVYICLLLLAFSCKGKEIKKPTNFINESKMVDLIVDMKIAQKAKNITNKDKKKNLNYMSLVFEKHQIDSLQFQENNDYYTKNIEAYQGIYEKVKTRLNDSVNKYKAIKKTSDSIKREARKNKSLLLLDKNKINKKKVKTPANSIKHLKNKKK